MIKKLEIPKTIRWDDEGLISRHIIIKNAYDKINELCDAVNEIMTWRFETDEDSDWYDDPKYREQPADPYEKQRRWVGCICRFWYDNPNETLLDYLDKIQTGKDGIEYSTKETDDWFPHCEPVLPTDNAIYKGE